MKNIILFDTSNFLGKESDSFNPMLHVVVKKIRAHLLGDFQEDLILKKKRWVRHTVAEYMQLALTCDM